MEVKERQYLEEPIKWREGEDPEYPYESSYDDKQLVVRVNDFPEEHLYTLIVDSNDVVDFDDWPATWVRDSRESLLEEDSPKLSARKHDIQGDDRP